MKTAEDGYFYATYEYQFEGTTIEPPSTDSIRFNNTMHDLVTVIWVHVDSALGKDNTNSFTQIATGNRLFLQDKDDASKWVSYDVTAPAFLKAPQYVEIPCAFVGWGEGAIVNKQRILFNVGTQLTAGPAGTPGPMGPPGATGATGPMGPPGASGATGVSLRDQFAMHIIGGMLVSPMAQDQNWFRRSGITMAYTLADAMIEESIKPQPAKKP